MINEFNKYDYLLFFGSNHLGGLKAQKVATMINYCFTFSSITMQKCSKSWKRVYCGNNSNINYIYAETKSAEEIKAKE